MSACRILCLSLISVLVVANQVTAASVPNMTHFGTNEHETIGNKVSLKTAETEEAKLNTLLTMPNGIELTYGQIVALAGDYYGVPGSPIINPTPLHGDGAKNETDEEDSRFMAAYGTLAIKPKDEVMKVLKNLLKMMREDTFVFALGVGHLHTDKDLDEATGGRWAGGVPVVFGTMMKLAVDNYDHFQPQAQQAYLVGHQLAIEKAREAGRGKKQISKLMEAYSMDAFAAHFLTDSFSAGHIRTPRYWLQKEVTPSKVGDLLSKFMHDEDGDYGLHVTNKRGDKWICYGDKHLRDGRKNMELVMEAVRVSVRQIYGAFVNPEKELSPSVVTDLLPFLDSTKKNNSPLFQMKNGTLHRRANINDLQDKETTTSWWGTTTVAALKTASLVNPAIRPRNW